MYVCFCVLCVFCVCVYRLPPPLSLLWWGVDRRTRPFQPWAFRDSIFSHPDRLQTTFTDGWSRKIHFLMFWIDGWWSKDAKYGLSPDVDLFLSRTFLLPFSCGHTTSQTTHPPARTPTTHTDTHKYTPTPISTRAHTLCHLPYTMLHHQKHHKWNCPSSGRLAPSCKPCRR